LGGWALQIGMSKHKSKKIEKEKWAGSAYGWSTKGIAKEKAGTSYMEKDTGIL